MNTSKGLRNIVLVCLFLLAGVSIISCAIGYERANMLNRQARALIKKQAYDKAQQKYEKALEYNKKSIEARIGLAKIYQQRGNSAQAFALLSEFDIYSARKTLHKISRSLVANLEHQGLDQMNITRYYNYSQKKYAGRGVFSEKTSALIELMDFIAASQDVDTLQAEPALQFIKQEIEKININEILAHSSTVSKHQLARTYGNKHYDNADEAWQAYVNMEKSIMTIKTKSDIKALRYAKRNYAEDRKILFFYTVLNLRFQKLINKSTD